VVDVTTQRAETTYRPRTSLSRTAGAAPRSTGSSGLTAAGVAVVVFVASLVGMLIGAVTVGALGWIFSLSFIAGTGYAAFQVRRRDIAAALIIPPLAFAVLVSGHEFVTETGSLVDKVAFALNEMLNVAPTLWIAVGVAVLVVGYRVWRGRRT
jgi:hypothetical protein